MIYYFVDENVIFEMDLSPHYSPSPLSKKHGKRIISFPDVECTSSYIMTHADPDTVNDVHKYGYPILHLFCQQCYDEKLIRTLIRGGADPDILMGDVGGDGPMTPLSMAVTGMNIVAAKVLISNDVDVNAPFGDFDENEPESVDDGRRYCISYALANDDVEMVELLFRNGARIPYTNAMNPFTRNFFTQETWDIARKYVPYEGDKWELEIFGDQILEYIKNDSEYLQKYPTLANRLKGIRAYDYNDWRVKVSKLALDGVAKKDDVEPFRQIASLLDPSLIVSGDELTGLTGLVLIRRKDVTSTLQKCSDPATRCDKRFFLSVITRYFIQNRNKYTTAILYLLLRREFERNNIFYKTHGSFTEYDLIYKQSCVFTEVEMSDNLEYQLYDGIRCVVNNNPRLTYDHVEQIILNVMTDQFSDITSLEEAM
jgi:hypothetical protein